MPVLEGTIGVEATGGLKGVEASGSASGSRRGGEVLGERPLGLGVLGGGVCSTVLNDSSESSDPAGLMSEGKSSSSVRGRGVSSGGKSQP